jgi:glycosyltransferase involved in cell wall biosynthesis
MVKTQVTENSKTLSNVSVVIPAYNEEAVIKVCLEALYKQREDIQQVIVVDNNSTDDTAKIVREFAAQWPAIKLISETRPGVVSARNAGLNAAHTDIIARIDADTVVLPGWAHAYRQFFASENGANVGASTGMAIPYDLPLARLSELVYQVFILQSNRLVTNSDTLFGTNMAIRREAWASIKDETCRKDDMMEDMDVGLHLRRHGYTVRVAPGATVTFSARRMLTNPIEYFRYARMWPMTYWYHGMKMTAILTWPFTIVGCLCQTLIWPVLRAYDPAKRRFSIKRLFSRHVSRMIPKGS